MLATLGEYFQDPWIRGAAWSGFSLICVFILIFFLRRIVQSLKTEDVKKQMIRRWITHGGLALLGLILIRIWAYTYLIRLFDPEFASRLLPSLIGFIIAILSIILIRRVIQTLHIDSEKKTQYQRWITTAITLLYVFILIRIWAVTNLFDVFKHPLAEKLYKSVLILGLVYLVLFFVRRFINTLKIDIAKRHQYRKRATYGATFLYILILIPLWAGTTQQWTTILSVMGAGIALALHEVLLNMAGWVYIVLRHPYKNGDRIELGDVRGDVIDIQLFQTTLLELGNWVDGDQSTGRVVHLPHGQIFRNPLHNYTKGFEFIWNEIPVVVTFESNWEKAKEILSRCGEEESQAVQDQVQRKIDRMAREYLIYYKRFTPIVYTKIEESGIKLTLRYLTEAKKRRSGEDTICSKIIMEFNRQDDIDFAYPTFRVYRRGEKA